MRILKFLFLRILGFQFDYLGRKRKTLGNSPYYGRSPIKLLILNLLQLKNLKKLSSDEKNAIKKTKSHEKTKQDKISLVIGNGPSLKKIDWERVTIDQPEIWVVNHFYRNVIPDKLPVSYYVLSDPDFFNFENSEIKSEVLIFARSKNCILILPHWAQIFENSIQKYGLEALFFDDRELCSWTNNIKPTKPRGYLSLTAYKALAFALFLGYEVTYILGIDNTEFVNYASDDKNRILIRGNHSYEDSAKYQDLTEHFLDGMSSALLSYSHSFGDLHNFKGNIVNLDKDSLITCFAKQLSHEWVN